MEAPFDERHPYERQPLPKRGEFIAALHGRPFDAVGPTEPLLATSEDREPSRYRAYTQVVKPD